ncbi:MAG: MFS transporter [candidate division KSB1 bacterium]|nr:MFS transporter [candidate division KSB1 bacterium]
MRSVLLSKSVSANLPKIYVLLSLRWMMFIIPILVIFFYDNGLDQTQVMILQSLFSIAIVLFEIPSGYFSDVMGRKLTVVLGCILGSCGFLIYSFSFGFWGFLAAELVLGLGASFISGTDSALVYDTLAQLGREAEYPKIEGRCSSICNFSETAASIIGGMLAAVSLRTPFYLETAFMLMTIPLALTLVEPERHRWDASQGNWNSILQIVRFSLHENKVLKWLIFYASVTGASTLTMVWFIQPYLKESGLPLSLFGVVWAALNFSVGIFSMYAYRIERKLGRRRILLLQIPLMTIGFILAGLFQTLWAIPVLFIFYFVRGINRPVMKSYINQMVSSDKRATVISVSNMTGRMIFALAGPVIGLIKDRFSLSYALFTAALIILTSGSIVLVFLNKHRVLTNSS